MDRQPFPIFFFFDQLLPGLEGATARIPQPPPQAPLRKAGGYPQELFPRKTEDDWDGLECSICYLVLRRTRQCKNNHQFCSTCIYNWSITANANADKCPVCRCTGPFDTNEAIDTKLGDLLMRCPQESCDWKGRLALFKLHEHGKADEEEITNLPPITARPPPGPAAPRRERYTHMRDQLQRSRERLAFLLAVLGDEIDVRRQSIQDYQQEREQRTREQIDEVNQLGQRLNNVAGNLMSLLSVAASNGSDDNDDDSDTASSSSEDEPARAPRGTALPSLGQQQRRTPSYAPVPPSATGPPTRSALNSLLGASSTGVRASRDRSPAPPASSTPARSTANPAPVTSHRPAPPANPPAARAPATRSTPAPPQPIQSHQSIRTIVINADDANSQGTATRYNSSTFNFREGETPPGQATEGAETAGASGGSSEYRVAMGQINTTAATSDARANAPANRPAAAAVAATPSRPSPSQPATVNRPAPSAAATSGSERPAAAASTTTSRPAAQASATASAAAAAAPYAARPAPATSQPDNPAPEASAFGTLTRTEPQSDPAVPAPPQGRLLTRRETAAGRRLVPAPPRRGSEGGERRSSVTGRPAGGAAPIRRQMSTPASGSPANPRRAVRQRHLAVRGGVRGAGGSSGSGSSSGAK